LQPALLAGADQQQEAVALRELERVVELSGGATVGDDVEDPTDLGAGIGIGPRRPGLEPERVARVRRDLPVRDERKKPRSSPNKRGSSRGSS
jgi:hypothetical protein